MPVSCRSIVGAAVLIGATTLITSQVVSRQQEPAGGPEAAMDQWLAFAEPGAEHARLARAVGTWTQESTHWMVPGAPPTESTGTAVVQSVLGGRFITQHVRSEFEMAGRKFDLEGMGLYGYDNLKGRHFFAWVDNMGTMMMTGEGTTDAEGNIVYHSTMPDPMHGGQVKVKSIFRLQSETANSFEMHSELPDGTWFQNMRVVSRRTE